MTQDTKSTSALRYAVIGAGMSGILAAIKLKERGEKSVVVYEKGDSAGGTWRENRYPGLTCDVPAHAYTYSFAPNPDWSAFYATGPEIKQYFEKVIDDYGVRDLIRYNSEVTECVWDDAARKWNLTLGDGRTDSADVVIAASGVLHYPNVPDIAGKDSFKGKIFHSARWDDSAVLDGARVGVIGCGSTGVQIVTALQQRSAKVVHFQRSPQWIMPVQQFDYSDADRAAFRADPKLIDDLRFGEQYWSGIYRFNRALTDPDGADMHEIEDLCLRNLEDSVKDPVLREKLRPDYRAACKRLIYSWNYYDAVQQPNVEVERAGIERIEENGIRMKDGTFHELDVIVLATGFKADRFIRPTVVKGKGGACLDDKWKVRPSAYYAISIPDMPNFFMLNGPTGPVGNFSLIDIAERQWGYIEQLLEKLRSGEAKEIAARSDAMEAYDTRRIAAARTTIFGSGCQSWYLDAEGVPASWPWGYQDFADAMEKPTLEDYELAA